MGGHWGRRDVLRALGAGGVGLSVGGAGFLAGVAATGVTAANEQWAEAGTARPCPRSSPGRSTRPGRTGSRATSGRSRPRRRSPTSRSPARSRRSCPGSTSATARTRRPGRRRTGSWATAWSTACGSSGGRATWYRNRYVRTPLAEAGQRLLRRRRPPGRDNSQSNVSIVHHAGKLLTLGEVGWPYELLDRGPVHRRPLGLRRAARRHHDGPPQDRPRHRADALLRLRVPATRADLPRGRSRRAAWSTAPIAIPAATMIHDFAITDRDAIFWIGPVLFGVDRLRTRNPVPLGPGRPVPGRRHAARRRRGRDPLGRHAPCFVFHGTNAHRDGDDVVLRVHRLDRRSAPRATWCRPA